METILTNMNKDSPLPKVLDENKGGSLVKSPNKRPLIQIGMKSMDKEKFNEHQAQLQVDNQFTIQPFFNKIVYVYCHILQKNYELNVI